MSDPVTALGGAEAQAGIAQVSEAALQGMVTLRGDLSVAAVKKAVKAVTGMAVPDAGRIAVKDDFTLCWMSPDELLILCSYDAAEATVSALTEAAGKAHMLAVNVSDARASFGVRGPHARDVMAKLCPVDLAADRFGPGMFRRTRLAQVAAAFWFEGPGEAKLVCFRSVARYVFDLLAKVSEPGSEVGHF